MRREFLMLANKYIKGKQAVNAWFMSEKLDGIRCFWDGGISRGLRCAGVPWANVAKHSRFLNEQFATGLWSRYGQPIHAPSWWLDNLPNIFLDGELYMGRKSWQALSSVVKTQMAGIGWQNVKYLAFDSPPLTAVFQDGEINNTNFKKKLIGCCEWATARAGNLKPVSPGTEFFRIVKLHSEILGNDTWYWHQQEELPLGFSAADSVVRLKLAEIEGLGGEGLMLRSAGSIWEPKRSKYLLKVKAKHDAEGTVVGYKFARPTDLDRSISGVKTDKLVGLMGSLRLRLENGKEFDLSGFTDLERQFNIGDAVSAYAVSHPGEETPGWIYNPMFPIGSRVTFKYRELSDDGLPKEAAYLRKPNDSL